MQREVVDGVASSEVHAASGKVRTFTLLNVITGLQLTINGCKLVLYADDFMVIQAYKELFLKRTLILYIQAWSNSCSTHKSVYI